MRALHSWSFHGIEQIVLSNPQKKLDRDNLDLLDKPKIPGSHGFPQANPHYPLIAYRASIQTG